MSSFCVSSARHGEFTVTVDDEDLGRVLQGGPWFVRVWRAARTVYVVRNVYNNGKRTSERLHNFILKRQWVDHINGDGLDNRKENLRPASPRENSQNLRVVRGSKSGFRGVTWSASKRKWRARVQTQGREHFLGYFDVAHAAAKAASDGRRRLLPFSNEERHVV